MKKFSLMLIAGIWAVVSGLLVCNCNMHDKTSQVQNNPQSMNVTTETLTQMLEAFNRHDLDAIMEFFSDDCSFDFPRGPEPWGQRFIGKAREREALANRFKGIPDVHYGDDMHWVSADGNSGVSQWTLGGTTSSGVDVGVRGCDLWELRNGKVIRKDFYWKIVEQGLHG
jgi:ketosteroid isomerase-like protein